MTSKPISIREYFARDGSEFSNKDAVVIGPVLEQLAEQGAVTARDVIDSARSKNSPLHSYFEWNDKIAADEYRLSQARSMLRSIKIKYTDGKETSFTARAFQITAGTTGYHSGPREYKSFKVLHGESAFAAQMMEMAYKDIQSWRSKYEPYQNIWDNFSATFAEVINQISELEGEVVHDNLPAFTDDAVAALLEWKIKFIDAHLTWITWVEQMKFMIEAIAETEHIFCATQTMKHRDCMRCGKSFLSYDGGNRICSSCGSLKSSENVSSALPGKLG